jgi:hypothetical protein
VATRDWLEDPTSALAGLVVPLYALATVGLWLLARPYGNPRWKLASASALVAAGVALLTNQAIAHLWERPRPFASHPALTHVLGARTTDPSFPSDHAAAAFAIAFAVFAFSRRAGTLFLAAATRHRPISRIASACTTRATSSRACSSGSAPRCSSRTPAAVDRHDSSRSSAASPIRCSRRSGTASGRFRRVLDVYNARASADRQAVRAGRCLVVTHRGSYSFRGIRPSDLAGPAPHPDAEPASAAAAERGRLALRGDVHLASQEIGLELHQEPVRGRPAVRSEQVESKRQRVDHVGDLVRDRLERGADDVRPGRPAGEAGDDAADVGSPLR